MFGMNMSDKHCKINRKFFMEFILNLVIAKRKNVNTITSVIVFMKQITVLSD